MITYLLAAGKVCGLRSERPTGTREVSFCRDARLVVQLSTGGAGKGPKGKEANVSARHGDWFRQAKRDLEHAKRALTDGDYEWTCFAAQQSAEKAVKALFLKAKRIPWGHSVGALLQGLPSPWQPDDTTVDAGKELDKHYIPPRYPNAYPQGAPYDYYTRAEAERAIAHCTHILAFCEHILAEPGSSQVTPEDSGKAPG